MNASRSSISDREANPSESAPGKRSWMRWWATNVSKSRWVGMPLTSNSPRIAYVFST
jgi:hypothetical protein